ncbi:uncharacterized protein KQ657_002308 [Scheffersomyces spartinae]|uniref:Uncharacterized protein n=1 Tax=Scheffersomyces spartinae TaxID=45513 RepID=A0A9P7VDR9_9ASCO|nr:uncharacterized protein KQ657_002308 [Scheffersomyces spartinae]KAG7195922.1 hypothetical protein KQ657_002308 [Scheffersomyces spartinae]
MSEGKDILYEVRGKVAIITLNLPKALNALNFDQYLLLGKLMEKADAEESTAVTIIQSTGRFWSAGANTHGIDSEEAKKQQNDDQHVVWLGNFTARNVWLTDTFAKHSKVIVVAANGPAIGLSAALMAQADLIYVKEEKDFWILTPFSNLGLVAEGASSATLFLRLGWSKASEALLFSRPIKGPDLKSLGFINQSYDGQFKSTEEFNDAIYKQIIDQFDHLYVPSIIANKKLLKDNINKLISAANTEEGIGGFNRFVKGIPQQRFQMLNDKKLKHKF